MQDTDPIYPDALKKSRDFIRYNTDSNNEGGISMNHTRKADCSATVCRIQACGSRHRHAGQPCEDVTLTRIDGDLLFCGLADGQSGTRYGSEGGRACLEAVADYIHSRGIGNLIQAPFPDELPCEIVKSFRPKLLSLAESSSAPMKEFASTLLGMAMDLKNGKYILIHLGDGSAVSILRTGEPVIISPPENGISPCHTWLTTSDTAVAHLRVAFGSLENKSRILLLSDGAACLCRGREIPRRAAELLKNGSQLQIYRQLLRNDPADDATCVMIDLPERSQ